MIGTKLVEVPYFLNQIKDDDISKDILIVGECKGGEEGISESIHELGCKNVTTTDILESLPGSWIRTNTEWNHVKSDFIKFDETNKYDFIISISVFEHFGLFWEGKAHDTNSDIEDMVLWNHDIQGILKSCRLLKNSDSKVIITLPVGGYMNYHESGYPMLRYYDIQRMEIIGKKLEENGYKFTEKFYYSPDFNSWYDVPGREDLKQIMYTRCMHHTPNIIWGLTIQKK
tara:strand:+ start:123 stop:809 length:687 start_codon:yes stop_codon:yes gene_type:complete